MSEKIWVETFNGRTQGNWEYYAAADRRIKLIRDRFREKKATKDQVEHAVRKITGLRRIDSDTVIAIENKKPPPGRHRPTWERDVFEAWAEKQPLEHRRIYGSPEVIALFITEEK